MHISSKIALGFIAGLLALSPHAARAQWPPAPITPPPLLLPTSGPPVIVVPVEPSGPLPEPTQLAVARGFDRARIGVGYRASFVRDPSFDAFSRSGLMSQLSLDATYAFVSVGRFALASGVAWDFGSLQGLFDGFDVSLQVHRFTVPIEARYVLTPWLYGFGRVAPGAALYRARVTELGAPLEGGPWVPAADFSGGFSILLGPHGVERPGVARVWLTPEVGYGLAGDYSIDLESRRGPIVDASVPNTLGALSVRGPFVRASIGMTL